jgi:hypothetical protein
MQVEPLPAQALPGHGSECVPPVGKIPVKVLYEIARASPLVRSGWVRLPAGERPQPGIVTVFPQRVLEAFRARAVRPSLSHFCKNPVVFRMGHAPEIPRQEPRRDSRPRPTAHGANCRPCDSVARYTQVPLTSVSIERSFITCGSSFAGLFTRLETG